MQDPYLYPKLRAPLDARFETIGEQRVVLLRCPLGITPQPLILNGAVAPLLACFQGNDSIDEIVARYASIGATKAIVQELMGLLDTHFFLETPKFTTEKMRSLTEYRAMEVRHPALAGLSYAPTDTLLAKEIDEYLGGPLSSPHPSASLPLAGIVSPHIDYRRGGAAYGHAYRTYTPGVHDLIVLIGTSHQYSPRLFHLTKKHFLTPLGTLKSHGTFIDRVASLHGSERSYEHEILHRQEHSLELQTPFLVRRGTTASIAPILVGGFHEMIAQGRPPDSNEEYQSFTGALTAALKEHVEQGGKFCFVAGVDMAHVGRYFGDTISLTEERLATIRERDESYLNTIQRRDLGALFSHIAEDNDARRICGFPTLYVVIDVLNRLGQPYTPRLIDYQQAVNLENDCCVTFSSMAFARDAA